jgi:predicted PurR-regulated permease PerM
VNGPATIPRKRLALVALLILAGIAIALTVLVAAPFVPGLTWALAFAVVTSPMHRWLAERLRKPNLAAGLAVAAVAIVLIAPAILIGWQISSEITGKLSKFEERLKSDKWRQEVVESNPLAARTYRWLESNLDVQNEARGLTEAVQRTARRWVRNTVWAITQILVALFALFYFFRDRDPILRYLRSLMPLSSTETSELFERIRAMTHATIYGTVVVAAIQGALGGLMFWVLGIPGALLWGVVMAVLAVIPVLGAFVVWVPAAIVLAAQGSWGKALILTLFGTAVIGLIDNLLYPMLVGKEMRLHTLPVFLAIVGGIILFGAAGVVLGPVILASTVAILEIVKRHTVPADKAS